MASWLHKTLASLQMPFDSSEMQIKALQKILYLCMWQGVAILVSPSYSRLRPRSIDVYPWKSDIIFGIYIFPHFLSTTSRQAGWYNINSRFPRTIISIHTASTASIHTFEVLLTQVMSNGLSLIISILLHRCKEEL